MNVSVCVDVVGVCLCVCVCVLGCSLDDASSDDEIASNASDGDAIDAYIDESLAALYVVGGL